MNRRILDARMLVPGDQIEVQGNRLVVVGRVIGRWLPVALNMAPTSYGSLAVDYVERYGVVVETAEEARRRRR